MVKILSADVAAMTELEVVSELESALKDKRKLRLGVVNAAKLVKMEQDSQLREDVLSSDLVLADGMSVVWASRILGKPLPERVAGIDLMSRLFEIANREGYGVYCLGASEEVSAIIESNLRRDYPDLVISGRRNGYFDEPEEADVAQNIRDAAPHILLVAMTSPKKENFMGRWDEHMNVPIVHGVGGSFDVYSGKVERAPESWQRLGLEWLYRVKQEPGRLWKRYAKTNLAFIWLVIKQKFNPNA
ncbi:MAG: N-acetylglucosaminyldiphosphoundecaprenol N-acetyl-beta-D-mannosaminyltransferase [Candidatus Azotimanducaceae bacterium]|jgi:N-acetylglucosaminyldiphosphoundecaprenol N-acetyl-beta-D-mannosaminyltransferase